MTTSPFPFGGSREIKKKTAKGAVEHFGLIRGKKGTLGGLTILAGGRQGDVESISGGSYAPLHPILKGFAQTNSASQLCKFINYFFA